MGGAGHAYQPRRGESAVDIKQADGVLDLAFGEGRVRGHGCGCLGGEEFEVLYVVGTWEEEKGKKVEKERAQQVIVDVLCTTFNQCQSFGEQRQPPPLRQTDPWLPHVVVWGC